MLVGVTLAGTSGAAVLAQTFTPVPMSFTAPFIVLPASLLLVCGVLLGRRLYGRLHLFSDLIVRGAVAALVATLVYDGVRPLVVAAFHFHYDPYQAISIFGELITHRPVTSHLAITLGWLYHFCNGVSFGIIYALIRPRGGILSGYVWGMVLYALTLVSYPTLVGAKLSNIGFVVTSFTGHSLWGLTLGFVVQQWALRRAGA